jgi:SecD/SecF fusion protein
MKSISTTRIVIIGVVTLLSIWFTIPTMRYYLHLRAQPDIVGTRVQLDEPEPDATIVADHAAWEQRHPDYVKWAAENKGYLDWEAESDRLRSRAIPLGLDLIGGVDVSLRLDRQKAIETTIQGVMDNLARALRDAKIEPMVNLVQNGTAFSLRLTNAADARQAASLIDERYGRMLDREVGESDLSEGQTITLSLSDGELRNRLDSAMEGALYGVRQRVDRLGVTQPSISKQGTDEIRVQVPGEKNPDKLIDTVIQPANLEFRLVSERQAEVIGPDGKRTPGVEPPLGTEVFPGRLGERNKDTGEIDYSTPDFLLLDRVELTGDLLRSAWVDQDFADFANPIKVALEFNPEGTKILADVTTAYVGRNLAILLDGVVRSAPTLEEPILNGRPVIRGGFSYDEATELSQILKAGSLPAPLVIEGKHTVGAKVGAESILASVRALGIGSLVIISFMILYYGTAGMIAVVALILNILIVLAIMATAHATLTLSGIGGILLTVGMAVDANVLIYERIREELAGGRPLRQAIGLGFNRAFSVIFDSNLTTLLTALVLLQFTEGSVKGFALAMAFGLLANLFTGLTVTFTLCSLWFAKFGHLSLGRLTFFRNANFDFIKMRFFTWSASGLLILAALAAVMSRGGLTFGVDFEGGYRADVSFTREVGESELRAALANSPLREPNVQPVIDAPNTYIVDVKLATLGATGDTDTSKTEQDLAAALGAAFPNQFNIEYGNSFGAQTASRFSRLAIVVIAIASFSILLYLWFRFELVFGAAAIVALIHDLIIVGLLSSLWGVAISLDVVAAFMVLLGFSVNDTIVIFDRIRENTRTLYGKTFGEICNLSMNQSLTRTIITSGTVLMAAFVLYLLGGEGLRPFAKVYLLGCIVGTYSSDFIAAPIVYQWNQYKGNRLQQALAEKKKKVEAAKPIRTTR